MAQALETAPSVGDDSGNFLRQGIIDMDADHGHACTTHGGGETRRTLLGQGPLLVPGHHAGRRVRLALGAAGGGTDGHRANMSLPSTHGQDKIAPLSQDEQRNPGPVFPFRHRSERSECQSMGAVNLA